ncbi:MAG TPA: NusG domain II-containing protein [Candidatus Eisenbergiella merdipullorum]|uniref:NusG domain II-containing protein n=1 Tax=Candidatus Eisenbergiella merdipullorum TaxID=2838553 RepID=A0A9D2I7J1_9FIRM|nr:NusG domain II-containing protein [Candidatus Eisenbergiella merdipullorum]
MKHMFDRAIMTKADLLLLAAVLGAAFLFALFLVLLGRKGNSVEVVCDGRILGEYSLTEDRRVPIRVENGENLLVIQDGQAWVEEADCPDGLCIRQGRISRVGESIICLPHRLAITITGGQGTEDGVDAVAGGMG